MVDSPRFNCSAGIAKITKPMLVEALIPEFPVEILYISILRRLTGLN